MSAPLKAYIETMNFSLLGGLSDFLLFVCLLLVVFYWYCNGFFNVWEQLGVPGPKPWPFLLHIPELRNGMEQAFDKWESEYGRTYGLQSIISRRPALVTTDTKLLYHIFVKDFDNFVNRASPSLSTKTTALRSLFFYGGSDWRRTRHVMSLMFTGGKLKITMYHANNSAATLVNLIKRIKAKGELVPLKKFMAKYTSDVIAKSGFGLKAEAVSDVDNEFFDNINKFLSLGSTSQQFFRLIGLYFPFISKIGLHFFENADWINPKADAYFSELANNAIETKREQKSEKVNDMLDLLLHSETPRAVAGPNEKCLTTKEIVANSVLLILAAYETTSSTLRSLLYLLAQNQDIQDKVIQEIDTVLDGRTEPEYEDLTNLKYTEQVIKEAIRLFPPVPILTREALETKTYDGVTIPKGSCVLIRVNKILRDPEYWSEPDKFNPDRFAPDVEHKASAVAYLAFGFGPRICIGKRLAILELKVALSQLLSNFRFVKTDLTYPKLGEDVKMVNVINTMSQPEKPIELDVVLRKEE
ncbi:cytochrome P450 3A9 [Aplysia californica]|uniref:Cytochrome P450 3A9 n=1 Tax=Aplysia californica TaxID=6500 RepID=A0ABM0JHC1_APLCA|nr:cytochrome P450 3A9 [Aplysia californica]